MARLVSQQTPTYDFDDLGEPHAQLDHDLLRVVVHGPDEPVVVGHHVVVEPLGVRVAPDEAAAHPQQQHRDEEGEGALTRHGPRPSLARL